MSTIIRPLVTEKMTKLSEKHPQYAFEVDIKANKHQIKAAVQTMYPEVTITAVNTLITTTKPKGRFMKGGYIDGRTKKRKKAIVTLKEGQTIDFFSEI
jgi:large subunit ribosomal protein L23